MKRKLRLALSKVLRELRGRRDPATQEMLAHEVGMDRSYWSDLERGERNVTLFSLWQLALALRISPSRLVLAIDKQYRRIGGPSNPARTPTEEALRRLREFMDQSPEMKWLADPGTKTLYCNAPLLRFLGVTSLEGLAWRELVHPDDLKKYLAQSRKPFARRAPYLSRYRMRGADGKYRLFVQQAVPQFTPKGIFLGFLGTMIQEPNRNGL